VPVTVFASTFCDQRPRRTCEQESQHTHTHTHTHTHARTHTAAATAESGAAQFLAGFTSAFCFWSSSQSFSCYRNLSEEAAPHRTERYCFPFASSGGRRQKVDSPSSTSVSCLPTARPRPKTSLPPICAKAATFNLSELKESNSTSSHPRILESRRLTLLRAWSEAHSCYFKHQLQPRLETSP
jgi:hypothetical protein